MDVSGSVDAANEGNLVTVHEPTTDAETSLGHSAVGGGWHQGDGDEVNSSDYDEEPLRFRSLNDVYDDSIEVELGSDSELGALLALMEEPANY